MGEKRGVRGGTQSPGYAFGHPGHCPEPQKQLRGTVMLGTTHLHPRGTMESWSLSCFQVQGQGVLCACLWTHPVFAKLSFWWFL